MATETKRMSIVTECWSKPIPTRNFDWSAVNGDIYDGPGSLIGYGPTEQAAIDDLMEQING